MNYEIMEACNEITFIYSESRVYEQVLLWKNNKLVKMSYVARWREGSKQFIPLHVYKLYEHVSELYVRLYNEKRNLIISQT